MTESTKDAEKHGDTDAAPKSGIAGIYDPKWIIVALCYIAAIAFMGQDPWYGIGILLTTRVFSWGFWHF